MLNEANAVLSHDAAIEVIAAHWRVAKMTVATEFELPNGKRADVIGATYTGNIFIAEVKTALKASLIEEAFEKYGRWCHHLFLAVPAITEAMIHRAIPLVGFPQHWHKAGVIGVYTCSSLCLRPASYRNMHSTDQGDILSLIGRAERKRAKLD